MNEGTNGSMKVNIKQEVKEYFYFVGYGNNQALIRSIFRKRGWWTETDCIEQANLVWTQTKVAMILKKT